MVVSHEDIVHLAREIGPRLPGSPQERRAAQYVAERLGELGVPTALLPMRTPRSFTPTYVALFLMILAGIALARWIAYLGLTVSLTGLVLLAMEAATRPVLTRFMATHRGNNVLGLIPAAQTHHEEPERRVIVSAHLDTARSGLLWQPPLVRWFRPLLLTVVAAAALVPLLLLAFAVTDAMLAWWLSLIPALVLLVAIGLLLERELRGKPVSGANDDASGVAAALGVVEALQRDRPHHVETWVLLTSGHQASLAGMLRFLRDNQFNRETTYFINLDTVGVGRVCFTSAEGAVVSRPSSPTLVRLAGEVAARRPEWRAYSVIHRLLPTDQFAALTRGYQAIGILAQDEQGQLPHWHQVSDTVEVIQPATVQRAADLALGIIRRLDQDVAERHPARLPAPANPFRSASGPNPSATSRSPLSDNRGEA